MVRKRGMAIVGGLAVVAVVTALVVAGGGAATGAPPLGLTPQEEGAALACGQSPLMVIHADLYILSRAGNPSETPQDAVERLVREHYPRMAPSALRRVSDDGTRTKFHVRGVGGGLLASFLTGSLDDEHYVEQVALCESTAKRWAR